MKCIICGAQSKELLDKQFSQIYFECPHCKCVFTDEKDYLNEELELDQYSRHNNSIESPGYVEMFDRFLDIVIPDDFKGKCLDFGSGPEPVLQTVIGRRGLECDIYDPYYADIKPQTQYDMITSTEVFEHFYDPVKEFELLSSLLKENGYLAVMTLFINEEIDFQNWWYRRDPTHVTFYNLETFSYLAKRFGFEIVKHNNKNIILLKKKCVI